MDRDDVEELRDRIDLGSSATKAEDFEAAAQDLAEGEFGRAAFLTMAAEHWQIRGDLDRARTLLDAAGPGQPDEMMLDPLTIRLSIEIAVGDEAAQEAALVALLARWRSGDLTVVSCSHVGETLEGDGQLKRAHRWFTMPLAESDPDDDFEWDEELCLTGRHRVRRELGMPVDRFDAVAAELIASGAELSTD